MSEEKKTKKDNAASKGSHMASSPANSDASQQNKKSHEANASKEAKKEAKKQAKEAKKQAKQQKKAKRPQVSNSRRTAKRTAEYSGSGKAAEAVAAEQTEEVSGSDKTVELSDASQTEQLPNDEQVTQELHLGETAAQSVPFDSQDTTKVMPPVAPATAYNSPIAESEVVVPASTASEAKGKKKHRALKGVFITLGVIVVLAAAVYAGVALYFTDRFMPDTTAGTIELSYMSADDAEKALMDKVDNYSLTISGDDFSLDLSSSDASLTMDTTAVVDSMLDDMNPWRWPLELFRDHDESDRLVATSNGEDLDEIIQKAVDEFNERAEQPVNATIAYDNDAQAFVIKEESIGTALDAAKIVELADNALASLTSKVSLDEDQLLQPTVFSTDEELVTAADKANQMLKANLTLTMGDDTVATIDASQISDWVQLDKDLNATLSDDKLSDWAQGLASECNTVGTTRSYTRPDGKTFNVSGGTYGWSVDVDSLISTVKSAISDGSETTEEVPCSSTAAVFDGQGNRDWGTRYCDIDLSAQHVYFYDDSGSVVWESDCVSGLPDGTRDTPTGVYRINGKESPSTLIGYENGEKSYETEVTYWMPFSGNSVGLHDATWQSSFGGSRYKTYGSHGCVNLPYDKAQALYGIIEVGDVVVCHW